jgi:hypothetical protein
MEHLRASHPNYEQLLKDYPDPSMLPAYYDQKSVNMYSWLDWVVTEGLPFKTVSKESFRKYSCLESISTETYMKYMGELTTEVENEIRAILPSLFCLVFDGWTLEGTSTHFVALFARFPVCLLFCLTYYYYCFYFFLFSFFFPCVFVILRVLSVLTI